MEGLLIISRACNGPWAVEGQCWQSFLMSLGPWDAHKGRPSTQALALHMGGVPMESPPSTALRTSHAAAGLAQQHLEHNLAAEKG